MAASPPADSPNSAPLAAFALDFPDWENWCNEHTLPRFRAEQIFRWLHARRAEDWRDMTDLPESLRQLLSEQFRFYASEVVTHQQASDRTEKLLLKLADGEFVECVLMREPDRNTICISTQVGCGMGCVFCASGLAGLTRNLTTAEIIEQVARLERLQSSDEKLTNVVVMGMGEPLANLKQLLPALRRMQHPLGLNLGSRRLTVSTVGLPEKIRELATSGKAYNLAVSLHAPNDVLRNQIVPVNKNIGITAILDAAEDYFSQTGRRVTYEYVLLNGINDALEQAQELATLLQGRNAHVNLIPMNAVSLLSIAGSSPQQARQFAAILEQANIAVTIRKRKGADIDAACGQLRLPHVQTQASLTAR